MVFKIYKVIDWRVMSRCFHRHLRIWNLSIIGHFITIYIFPNELTYTISREEKFILRHNFFILRGLRPNFAPHQNHPIYILNSFLYQNTSQIPVHRCAKTFSFRNIPKKGKYWFFGEKLLSLTGFSTMMVSLNPIMCYIF